MSKPLPTTTAELADTRRKARIGLAVIAVLLLYGVWNLFLKTHPPVDVSGAHYVCYQSSQTGPAMTAWNLARTDTAVFNNVVDYDPENTSDPTFVGLTENQREAIAIKSCRDTGSQTLTFNAVWMVPLLAYGVWRARRYNTIADAHLHSL